MRKVTRLEPLIESLFQPRPVHPADLQGRCILEYHGVVAVGVLHHFLDEIEVDDVRAVNPDEPVWIELGFETTKNLAVEIRLSPGMDGHVNTSRGDPSNV